MTHEKLDKSREPTAVRGQGPYGVAWWTTANRNWGDNIDTNRGVNCGSAQVAWEVDCGESGMVLGAASPWLLRSITHVSREHI